MLKAILSRKKTQPKTLKIFKKQVCFARQISSGREIECVWVSEREREREREREAFVCPEIASELQVVAV